MSKVFRNLETWKEQEKFSIILFSPRSKLFSCRFLYVFIGVDFTLANIANVNH